MSRFRLRRRGGTQTQASGRRLGVRLIVAGVVLGVLAWGVGIAVVSQIGANEDTVNATNQGAVEGDADAQDISRPNNGPCAAQVVCVVDEYKWDIYDKRQLIGYSENVFAGRVTERAGTKAAETTIPGDEEDPHTQYTVEVLGVAKSKGPKPLSAGDRVTVDQLGGPGAKTGKRHVAAPMSCGQQFVGGPLAVGDEYLFATRYDNDTSFHDVSAPPAGAEPVSSVGTREDNLTAYRLAADRELDPLAEASSKASARAAAGGENLCR